VISAADDPGRIGVSAYRAYTYFHIPMVGGIIVVAAADELTIAHPSDGVTVPTTALILGGPALYLVGSTLFKLALWNRLPRSRLIAICALVALVPVGARAGGCRLFGAGAPRRRNTGTFALSAGIVP
jgi:low temperature requirement protein LtrA